MEPDENRAGLVRRDHQGTARRAAEAVRPASGTQRATILAFIESRVGGATRDEVADALGLSDNSVRPRVKELLDAGFISASVHLTRPSRVGSSSEVLFAAKAAPQKPAAPKPPEGAPQSSLFAPSEAATRPRSQYDQED